MKTFAFIISLLLLAQNAFAVTYRTMTDGLMGNASIWSPSMPSFPLSDGDTIIIQNDILLGTDIGVEGILIIDAASSLECMDKAIHIEASGKVIVNGLLKVKSINNDGRLTNNGRIEIYGNLINNGASSFIDGTNGTFRLLNNAISNAGGTISGSLDFCVFDEVSNPIISNSGTVDWSTVSICGAPLPVKILSFTAKEIDKEIMIEWATTEEKDNSHFEVEKSFDGNQFSVLSIVNATGGYNGVNHYMTFDGNNYYEEIYYRLKQVDIDGMYEYSNIITINTDNEFNISIYPNPADNNSGVMCRISNEEDAEIFIVIIDQCGQKIFQKTLRANEGKEFMVNENFLSKPGIYFVLVNQGDRSYNKKLLVK